MLATTTEMLATIQNMNIAYNIDWAPQNFYQMPQSVFTADDKDPIALPGP